MRALPLALLALVVAAPAAAQSDEPEAAVAQARARFEQGMTAMRADDPATAVEHFEASLEVLPYLPTAYNLAVALEALGRNREAANQLDRILAGELGEVTEAQREEARALWDTVRARIGLVEVSASGADGIWVRVDDAEATRGVVTGAVRVALDPGHHVLFVGAPDQRPRRLAVRAEAGVVNHLTVRFDARETGSLRVTSDVAGRLEIVGFATGPSPLEHDLPAGVYEVGREGDPASRRTVRVAPGERQVFALGPGDEGGEDDTIVWVIAITAVVLGLASGAAAIAVAASGEQAPLEEPVFGIIAALRF